MHTYELKTAYRESVIRRGEAATDALVKAHCPAFGDGTFFLSSIGSKDAVLVWKALVPTDAELDADKAKSAESAPSRSPDETRAFIKAHKSKQKDDAWTLTELGGAYRWAVQRLGKKGALAAVRKTEPKFDDSMFDIAMVALCGRGDDLTTAINLAIANSAPAA